PEQDRQGRDQDGPDQKRVKQNAHDYGHADLLDQIDGVSGQSDEEDAGHHQSARGDDTAGRPHGAGHSFRSAVPCQLLAQPRHQQDVEVLAQGDQEDERKHRGRPVKGNSCRSLIDERHQADGDCSGERDCKEQIEWRDQAPQQERQHNEDRDTDQRRMRRKSWYSRSWRSRTDAGPPAASTVAPGAAWRDTRSTASTVDAAAAPLGFSLSARASRATEPSGETSGWLTDVTTRFWLTA